MVHQWQDETGRAIDHGAGFRAKARDVGIAAAARRAPGAAPLRFARAKADCDRAAGPCRFHPCLISSTSTAFCPKTSALFVTASAASSTSACLPIIGIVLRRRPLPEGDSARPRRARRIRREPARGVRLRGTQQRGVRADHAGARARRLGRALVRVGAGRAGHVSDLRVRQRGAEEATCREWRRARSSAASV